MLSAYGPLFFPIMEAILPKLSPVHWDFVNSVKTEDDVDRLLEKTFARQDVLVLLPTPLSLCSLTFVHWQDYYKGRCYQGVYESDTSNIEQASLVVGLYDAQIALLVYFQLREAGQRANPIIFFDAVRGRPSKVACRT